MRAISPSGALIVGTCDIIYATAIINDDSFRRDDEGFLFDYAGESEVDWNSQEVRKDDLDEFLFQDEDGNEWTENEIKLIDEFDLEVMFSEEKIGWMWGVGEHTIGALYGTKQDARRAGRLYLASLSK